MEYIEFPKKNYMQVKTFANILAKNLISAETLKKPNPKICAPFVGLRVLIIIYKDLLK